MTVATTTLRTLFVALLFLGFASSRSVLACNGDGTVDIGEDCDLAAGNGAADTCCTATCTIRPAGEVCRTSVDACDFAESCTGAGDICPGDGFVPGPKQCKATVTLAPPDFGQPLSADMEAFLETNVGLLERGSQGTFTMQKGTAKVPKYRNFELDGKTPAPAWVALLITNDALSAPLEISWKSRSFKSVYTADPGEQIIVAMSMSEGKKPVSFKIKSKAPAAGTLDFVSLSPLALSFAVTDTPRPLMINESTKKPVEMLYTIANPGPGALWSYSCPTASYVSLECATVQVVPANTTGLPLDLSVGPGSSFWVAAEPSFSAGADLQFSERIGIGYATRGCVGC